ncbi:MAG: hypothetical protein CMF70_06895 [Magnetovibrio sp.]|nr:hypothetical protein [Magnetovibrio sp.]|tara:strand:- start:1542 stop:1736 length:195 start_codon:yes stop_codon:yes gene_type:complete
MKENTMIMIERISNGWILRHNNPNDQDYKVKAFSDREHWQSKQPKRASLKRCLFDAFGEGVVDV